MSADVINFAAKGSSVSKGESLKDTAQTLQAMGADAVVIRHAASGAPHALAHSGWVDTSVINAGDGTHQHPTQALLDAFTIRRHLSPGGVRRVGPDGEFEDAPTGFPALTSAQQVLKRIQAKYPDRLVVISGDGNVAQTPPATLAAR